MSLTAAVRQDSQERMAERNSRTLFLKFSDDACIKSEEAIHHIVPKATCIRIPGYCSRNTYFKHAFVEFTSKEEADEQHTILKTFRLPLGTVSADILNEKPQLDLEVDPLRLYVTGIPKEATVSQLQNLFPKASISRNDSSKFRNRADFKTYAYVTFKSEKEARNAFWDGKNMEISKQKLLVLYANKKAGLNLKMAFKIKKKEKRQKRSTKPMAGTTTSKKRKLSSTDS